jgi:hypothetical protein
MKNYKRSGMVLATDLKIIKKGLLSDIYIYIYIFTLSQTFVAQVGLNDVTYSRAVVSCFSIVGWNYCILLSSSLLIWKNG